MKVFYKTTHVDRYSLLKGYSRSNRNVPTDAEYVLWQRIRKEQLGVKFRRQHAILDFIADFVCLEKKLIIEVDGEYHFTKEQEKADSIRTERLESIGFKIIRFTNNEVLYEMESVINKINMIINT